MLIGKGKKVGLWLACLLLMPGLCAAEVRAWLDRNSMQADETVTLNVEVEGVGGAQPDFSLLQTDFELLGTSSSSSVNIVNGQSSAKQLWAIGLQPRHAGQIQIPALKVGAESTAPLQLSVEPPSAVASRHSGDEIFVSVDAEPRAPYVQQQVRFSVKLYYAVNLSEGALDEPRVADVVVQKLGQDRNYEAEQGGRRYRVLERRYALLPEKSGNLEIPAIGFRGRAIDGNDPGGVFFSRGRTVAARSAASSLQVRPRPGQSDHGAWLPAQSLQWTAEGIDSAATAKVGEPITLTLTLRAQGLGFEQLPELELPSIDGAEVYPDKSTTRTRDDGNWIYGERSRKFAIVPTRAGKLNLPEMKLDWWDTAKDSAQTAILPATVVTVQASATASTGAGQVPAIATVGTNDAAAAVNESAVASTASVPAQDSSGGVWRGVALASLVLWAISAFFVYFFWRRPRLVPDANSATERPNAAALGSRGAFARALERGDAAAAARALLRWAQAEGYAVRNLGERAPLLASDNQRKAIEFLQRAGFAADAASAYPKELTGAFDGGLRRAETRIPRHLSDDLAPLWPKSAQRSG